jgi:hypothetical protein
MERRSQNLFMNLGNIQQPKLGLPSISNNQWAGRDALAPSPRPSPVPTGEGEFVAASGRLASDELARLQGLNARIFFGEISAGRPRNILLRRLRKTRRGGPCGRPPFAPALSVSICVHPWLKKFSKNALCRNAECGTNSVRSAECGMVLHFFRRVEFGLFYDFHIWILS